MPLQPIFLLFFVAVKLKRLRELVIPCSPQFIMIAQRLTHLLIHRSNCLQVNLPQLIGAVGGARNAFAVQDIGTNIAINASVVLVCVLLLRQDLKVGVVDTRELEIKC